MASHRRTARTRPLFGLLIGINDYASPNPRLQHLRGAVADARSFKDWLQWLGTPDDQIVLLTDKYATYSSIIKSLKKLKKDRRISKGDPIFIYYAGHGTQLPAPTHWNWGNHDKQIQAIVPYDCDVVDSRTNKLVPPITDIYLGTLLGDIALAKGNNITVVFDCCYAGSGTRSKLVQDDNSSLTARSVELRNNYFDQMEQQMRNITLRRFSSTFQKFEQSSLESHVLLAACRRTEEAYEAPIEGDTSATKRGVFSMALLKLLHDQPLDKLRYSDILNGIERINKQNPQCDGNHTDRVLFNARVLPSRRRLFPVQYYEHAIGSYTFKYVIMAGTIHKITPRTHFSLFLKYDVDLKRQIGTLSVTMNSIGIFSSGAVVSITDNRINPRSPMIAVQTNVGREGDLRVYVPPGNRYLRIHQQLIQNHDLDDIALVHNIQEADIETKVSQNKVVFTLRTINHINLPPYKWVRTIDFDPSATGEIAKILSANSHFYRELKLAERRVPITDSIEIIFHEVVSYPGSFEQRWGPVNPCVNLYKNGVIFVHHNPEIKYGLKLVNHLKFDLYPSVFFFCNDTLSITPWFISTGSASSYISDVPLQANDVFTIGYGPDSGCVPLVCELEGGQDRNVEYLKIYLATNPVKLLHVPQTSPFLSPRVMKALALPPPAGFIDMIIPIISQRR